MITRVAEDNRTIQILLIDLETYQFMYSKRTQQIEEAYTVRKDLNKTYYNPVPLDMIELKYIVTAYRKIKTYLESKNENPNSNR